MGRNSTIHPDRVPIGQAHDRIDDRVRLIPTGHRIAHADDVDPTLRAAAGHALMYDTVSGLWKAVLAPAAVTFNINGALSVVSTDRMPMGSAGRVCQAAALLTTAGSSTTTAILKHTTANDATTTTLATFSFSSSSKTPSSYPTISFVFAQYDKLWVDVTAAGTGAAGLVVPVWATAP